MAKKSLKKKAAKKKSSGNMNRTSLSIRSEDMPVLLRLQELSVEVTGVELSLSQTASRAFSQELLRLEKRVATSKK